MVFPKNGNSKYNDPEARWSLTTIKEQEAKRLGQEITTQIDTSWSLTSCLHIFLKWVICVYHPKRKVELKITSEILSEILDKATTLLKIIAIILKRFTLAVTCRHLTGVFNILPKHWAGRTSLPACLQCEPSVSQQKSGLRAYPAGCFASSPALKPWIPVRSSVVVFMSLHLSSFQHTSVVLLI